MSSSSLSLESSSALIKQNVAELLREEILTGGLQPGDRVVEGKWASRLGVAQGSVREALNILAVEGFIDKPPGRIARITKLSAEDVMQRYEVRAALEGLAARLVAIRNMDLSDLRQNLADMKAAAEQGNMRALIERDLQFHLLLCKKSGNRYLLQEATRLLVPLFAFTAIRTIRLSVEPKPWISTLEEHRQIVNVIELGDPAVAQKYVANTIERFASDAMQVWIGDGNSQGVISASRRSSAT